MYVHPPPDLSSKRTKPSLLSPSLADISPPSSSRLSAAKLLDLTSPLQRSRTPEPKPTADYFVDPKLPTYGGTFGGLEDDTTEGMSLLIGWDSTPDAQIAQEQ